MDVNTIRDHILFASKNTYVSIESLYCFPATRIREAEKNDSSGDDGYLIIFGSKRKVGFFNCSNQQCQDLKVILEAYADSGSDSGAQEDVDVIVIITTRGQFKFAINTASTITTVNTLNESKLTTDIAPARDINTAVRSTMEINHFVIGAVRVMKVEVECDNVDDDGNPLNSVPKATLLVVMEDHLAAYLVNNFQACVDITPAVVINHMNEGVVFSDRLSVTIYPGNEVLTVKPDDPTNMTTLKTLLYNTCVPPCFLRVIQDISRHPAPEFVEIPRNIDRNPPIFRRFD